MRDETKEEKDDLYARMEFFWRLDFRTMMVLEAAAEQRGVETQAVRVYGFDLGSIAFSSLSVITYFPFGFGFVRHD